MDLMEKIKTLGDMHAIDFIGIANISQYKNEIESIGGAISGEFPRAISIGIILPLSIINLLGNKNTYENLLEYKMQAYDIIINRLDNFASIVSSVIQKAGYKVLPIPSAERIDSNRVCASISHKLTARLAGFGWIGKNCLLIHPEYGPAIRWTTVLTDAPFPENQTIMEDHCGHCMQCTNACPAGAIKGRNFLMSEPRELRLDVAKCEAYFREVGKLTKLSVCGMCIYACPYWKKHFHTKKQTTIT